MTTVTSARRGGAPQRPRFPLWVWAVAGFGLGLLLSLALTPGTLPVVVGLVVAVAVLVIRPWTIERRRLDQVHERVAASRPLATPWRHSAPQ